MMMMASLDVRMGGKEWEKIKWGCKDIIRREDDVSRASPHPARGSEDQKRSWDDYEEDEDDDYGRGRQEQTGCTPLLTQ